jgi:hypothetical protein
MKLAALLALMAVPGCLSFYPKRPTITIEAGSFRVSEVGDYHLDYTTVTRAVSYVPLYVIDDPSFGCPGYDISNITSTLPSKDFALMVPNLGANSPCLEFYKARTAMRLGASGLIFQYGPQGGWLGERPPQVKKLSGITVVTVELTFTPALVYQPGVDPDTTVSIIPHYHQFQTSQTFYFIVFAFCILMLLSCLWFVMSYVKRCHYNIQRRRRRVRFEP